MPLRTILTASDGFVLEMPANAQPGYSSVERLNRVSVEAADGNIFIVDLGPTRVNASKVFKNVSYDFMKQYENFILNKVRMGLSPFRITCPDFDDFGMGKGVPIPAARYSGPSNLDGIIKPSGGGGLYYDIELPYVFVKGA